MRQSFFISLLLLVAIPTALVAQEKLHISIEDIFEKGTFSVKSVAGFRTMKNGISYSQINTNNSGTTSIDIYSIVSGKKEKNVFNSNEIQPVQYTFNQTENKLLLLTDAESIYRRSILYKTYLYDIQKKQIQLIDENKILHPDFSPDGQHIAFVKDNNLFLYHIGEATTKAITQDGIKNQIINGNCDWVYEEEFSFTQAYQWSPDGQYLAYYKFDESKVKEYSIPFYNEGNPYPEIYTYKYPKAGEDNSIVSIHIYDVATGKDVQADIGKNTDIYIPRIKWTQNNQELCIYRLNRLQNKLELLLADAQNGQTEVIYTEENPYYIDINDNLTFLSDKQSLIINSERDGFNHLYKWNWATQSLIQITQGNWDVSELHGIDEKKQLVYYSAHKDSPLEAKLYSTKYHIAHPSTSTVCLTPQSGNHQISPCAGFRYFLDRHSSINGLPTFSLIDHSGKTIRILEDNHTLKQTMEKYHWGKVQLLQVPSIVPNEKLHAYMITPPDFDSSIAYPVLMFQYSGPGSQQVLNNFPLGNYFWHQLLAQKGYIIFCVDGIGTGNRGEEFKKKTYLQLGKYESETQAQVARYLAQKKFVDSARIGIWGWSYGGFISSICLLKYNDVFKTAIAVAPVTNWRYYDNIYTERYMRKPQDNPQGYDDNAPETMAKGLKGNYLLIHGTADDNVHFQNAAAMTRELVKEGKHFRSEYYTNKNHGIYGGKTRTQLYKKMTEFIIKEL